MHNLYALVAVLGVSEVKWSLHILPFRIETCILIRQIEGLLSEFQVYDIHIIVLVLVRSPEVPFYSIPHPWTRCNHQKQAGDKGLWQPIGSWRSHLLSEGKGEQVVKALQRHCIGIQEHNPVILCQLKNPQFDETMPEIAIVYFIAQLLNSPRYDPRLAHRSQNVVCQGQMQHHEIDVISETELPQQPYGNEYGYGVLLISCVEDICKTTVREAVTDRSATQFSPSGSHNVADILRCMHLEVRCKGRISPVTGRCVSGPA